MGVATVDELLINNYESKIWTLSSLKKLYSRSLLSYYWNPAKVMLAYAFLFVIYSLTLSMCSKKICNSGLIL